MKHFLIALILPFFITLPFSGCSGGESSGDDSSDTDDSSITIDFKPGVSGTPYSLQAMPDGKILVTVRHGPPCFLGRLNSNGSIDKSFGNNGILETPNTCESPTPLPDGKFLLLYSSGNDVTLYRYLNNGTLDASFNGDGKSEAYDLDITDFYVMKMAVLSDGTIMVAAKEFNTSSKLVLLKFNSEGNIITSGSGHSTAIIDLDSINRITAIELQADGKLLVSGVTHLIDPLYPEPEKTLILRYTNDGTLDSGFGNNGQFEMDNDETYFVGNLALQHNGRVIVQLNKLMFNYLDMLQNNEKQVLLLGLTSEGQLDETFGNNGMVNSHIPATLITGKKLTVLDDDRLALSMLPYSSFSYGFFAISNNELHLFEARFLPDGQPDPAFGHNGYSKASINSCYIEKLESAHTNNTTWIVFSSICSGDTSIKLLHIDKSGNAPDLLSTPGTRHLAIDLGLDDNPVDMHINEQSDLTMASNSVAPVMPACVIITQYNSNGFINTGFGNNGKTHACGSYSTDPFTYSSISMNDMAISADGSIMIAASLAKGEGESFVIDSLVMRFLSDGQPDTTFADDGNLLIKCCNYSKSLQRIVLQPDKKFIVAGTDWGQSILRRYNADGTPDSTFNDTVFVTTALLQSISHLLLQADGKIIIAGYSSHAKPEVFRLMPEGSIDQEFNNNVENNRYWDYTDIFILPDNKIIFGESADIDYADDFSYGIRIGKLNNDGSADLTFGRDGYIVENLSSEEIMTLGRIATQPDGKIITAALYIKISPEKHSSEIAVFRYTADGKRDSSFGNHGRTVTKINRMVGYISNVQVQPDGKIVVLGTILGNDLDLMLVRFNSNGSVDNSYGMQEAL